MAHAKPLKRNYPSYLLRLNEGNRIRTQTDSGSEREREIERGIYYKTPQHRHNVHTKLQIPTANLSVGEKVLNVILYGIW